MSGNTLLLSELCQKKQQHEPPIQSNTIWVLKNTCNGTWNVMEGPNPFYNLLLLAQM